MQLDELGLASHPKSGLISFCVDNYGKESYNQNTRSKNLLCGSIFTLRMDASYGP